MKKIFSLPSISSNSHKESEFYLNDVTVLDHANSSIDLTDEKRVKLEQLQSRLSALYEELDKVLIKEEELTILDYRNKKRKIEPISNFNNSIESLDDKLNESSSSSKSSNERASEDFNEFDAHDISIHPTDQLDFNSNYTTHGENEQIHSKFYSPVENYVSINQKNVDNLSDHLTNHQSENHSENHLYETQLNRFNSQTKNNSRSRKKVNSSKSFVINRSKVLNSPLVEQDEKSFSEYSRLTKRIDNLKERLSNAMNENNQLKTTLKQANNNERVMRMDSRQLEEKITSQKVKIEQLHNKLTESMSNYKKLKVEHEQFKIEMQIEREKFTNFVLEESKIEQTNNEKKLKLKLKEKDQLIANLINEIENLRMNNSKNKSLTIDLMEKNKLLSSQQISLDQAIKSISIFQKNNVPELLMINLDDSVSPPNNSTLNANQLERTKEFNQRDESPDRLLKCDIKTETINNQSTAHLNGSIRQFCDQINSLQKEFSVLVDEEEKRSFMLKIEEIVLKNMRKLLVDKMDHFIDTLQFYLAQCKFDIIKFAIENEQKRQQSTYTNCNLRKSTSSIEWLKMIPSNLTSKKDPQTQLLDQNNNTSKQINTRNRTLRTNLQSRTVERRMIELRRSIETYLKVYLVRIVLEIQDQNN